MNRLFKTLPIISEDDLAKLTYGCDISTFEDFYGTVKYAIGDDGKIYILDVVVNKES